MRALAAKKKPWGATDSDWPSAGALASPTCAGPLFFVLAVPPPQRQASIKQEGQWFTYLTVRTRALAFPRSAYVELSCLVIVSARTEPCTSTLPPHGAQFPILSLSALADALQFKRDTAPESFPSQMKWWCASDFRVWSGTQWVLLEGWQAWGPLGRASPGKRVTNPPPDPWNDAGPNETVSALRCFARRPGSAVACTLRMSQFVAPRLSSSPPTQKDRRR